MVKNIDTHWTPTGKDSMSIGHPPVYGPARVEIHFCPTCVPGETPPTVGLVVVNVVDVLMRRKEIKG